MASEKLNDHELKRLENTRRNDDKLHSKTTQLSNFKRQRRSLRTRGIPPDCGGLDGDSVCPTTPSDEKPPCDVSLGPLSMANARESAHYDSSFLESPMGMAQDDSVQKEKVVDSLELESLSSDPENIARVTSGRITNVTFFQFQRCQNACRGEQVWEIGFWNVGNNEVHLYRPHQAPISGILIQPHCYSKGLLGCRKAEMKILQNHLLPLSHSNDFIRFTSCLLWDCLSSSKEKSYDFREPTHVSHSLQICNKLFRGWDACRSYRWRPGLCLDIMLGCPI
ncbi:hypothetical protein VNO80_20506 [Phaseolus coccineus]|uniref:Uncharacterized protein n=1 Tax=Phaseolus coccineus TaxID=3886 RepID=A0AAN9QWS5_PHACN